MPLLPVYKDREWTRWAIGVLRGDANRSADTHLVRLKFGNIPGISVYLKDEVHASDRKPEAPSGPVVVSLWDLQRLDLRGHNTGGGIFGLHGGQ